MVRGTQWVTRLAKRRLMQRAVTAIAVAGSLSALAGAAAGASAGAATASASPTGTRGLGVPPQVGGAIGVPQPGPGHTPRLVADGSSSAQDASLPTTAPLPDWSPITAPTMFDPPTLPSHNNWTGLSSQEVAFVAPDELETLTVVDVHSVGIAQLDQAAFANAVCTGTAGYSPDGPPVVDPAGIPDSYEMMSTVQNPDNPTGTGPILGGDGSLVCDVIVAAKGSNFVEVIASGPNNELALSDLQRIAGYEQTVEAPGHWILSWARIVILAGSLVVSSWMLGLLVGVLAGRGVRQLRVLRLLLWLATGIIPMACFAVGRRMGSDWGGEERAKKRSLARLALGHHCRRGRRALYDPTHGFGLSSHYLQSPAGQATVALSAPRLGARGLNGYQSVHDGFSFRTTPARTATLSEPYRPPETPKFPPTPSALKATSGSAGNTTHFDVLIAFTLAGVKVPEMAGAPAFGDAQMDHVHAGQADFVGGLSGLCHFAEPLSLQSTRDADQPGWIAVEGNPMCQEYWDGSRVTHRIAWNGSSWVAVD